MRTKDLKQVLYYTYEEKNALVMDQPSFYLVFVNGEGYLVKSSGSYVKFVKTDFIDKEGVSSGLHVYPELVERLGCEYEYTLEYARTRRGEVCLGLGESIRLSLINPVYNFESIIKQTNDYTQMVYILDEEMVTYLKNYYEQNKPLEVILSCTEDNEQCVMFSKNTHEGVVFKEPVVFEQKYITPNQYITGDGLRFNFHDLIQLIKDYENVWVLSNGAGGFMVGETGFISPVNSITEYDIPIVEGL